MAWQSRGLRGSALEELINLTNDKYREHSLALIQKVPTPIKPIKLDQEKGHISLAYFEKRSTVDYIGVVQGIPICFEAKETTKNGLPLQNIHQHQIDFMTDFEKQDGIAFLIVFFALHNEYYYLPFKQLKEFYLSSSKKTMSYEMFEKQYKIDTKSGYYLHYLEPLGIYLDAVGK
ncbi:MAG: Holliday junction resolvase RecU [Firmicutes bacterium HGW-Firmicutes-7]|nr:MAG: Holliday junction resolvase RecU [Firmicutes bacterium HGW-Firmicutes-7]